MGPRFLLDWSLDLGDQTIILKVALTKALLRQCTAFFKENTTKYYPSPNEVMLPTVRKL